jgi:hypothetical protein
MTTDKSEETGMGLLVRSAGSFHGSVVLKGREKLSRKDSLSRENAKKSPKRHEKLLRKGRPQGARLRAVRQLFMVSVCPRGT